MATRTIWCRIWGKGKPGRLKFCALAGVLILCGCESWNWSSAEDYLTTKGIAAPLFPQTVVCHGYDCAQKTQISLTDMEWGEIRAIFTPLPQDASTERNLIARAIARLETLVGPRVGTEHDKGRLYAEGLGDPGQQDCIDEATTTTGYLLLMAKDGLLTHHQVEAPAMRGALFDGRWPHMSAVIRERASGTNYVVDSWVGDNGSQPDIMTLQKWMLTWNW
jgi:hypothetical protein